MNNVIRFPEQQRRRSDEPYLDLQDLAEWRDEMRELTRCAERQRARIEAQEGKVKTGFWFVLGACLGLTL